MSWKLADTLEPKFDGALVDNKFIKAGLFVVKTKAQRNTEIKKLYRTLDGATTTLCYVSADRIMYELTTDPAADGTQDSDWSSIDFGVSDILTAQGLWDQDNTNPVLQDTGAVGNGNDFYVVTGAPAPVAVQHTGLFGGALVTVKNGDWVISNGTEWFVSAAPIDWDSISNVPSVIDDYVIGNVIVHTHAIGDVTGLQAALDLKYDLSNVGDHGTAWASIPDAKLVDVFLIKDNYYEKTVLYTKTEIDALITGVSPLTTKGDLIGHDGATQTRVAGGADAQVLTADAASPSGFKWADSAAGGSWLITGTTTLIGNTIIDSSLYGVNFDVGDLSTGGVTISGDLDTDLDVSVFKIRNELGIDKAAGLTDVHIGASVAGDNTAMGNLVIGNNNLEAIVPVSEFQGGRNLVWGFDNGSALIGTLANDATHNILIGRKNMMSDPDGGYNIVIGYENMLNSVRPAIGDGQNQVIGTYNMQSIDGLGSGSADYNTIIAWGVARNTTDMGQSNVMIGNNVGADALFIGEDNTFIGDGAVKEAVWSAGDDFNTAIGQSSLRNSAIATNRTLAIGVSSMRYGGGVESTAIGRFSGFKGEGDFNLYLGYKAGETSDWAYVGGAGTAYTGDGSTFIGDRVGFDVSTPAIGGVTVIGNAAYQPVLVADTVYFGSAADIELTTDHDGTPTIFRLSGSDLLDITNTHSFLKSKGGFTSLAKDPTITEDGYLVAWNNTTGAYNVIAPAGIGSFWKLGGVSTLSGVATVAMGDNDLTFTSTSGIFEIDDQFFFDTISSTLITSSGGGASNPVFLNGATAPWSIIVGDEHTIDGTGVANVFVTGWHNAIGNNVGFNGNASMVFGVDNVANGVYSWTGGFAAESEGFGAFAYGTYFFNIAGLLPVGWARVKAGASAINISRNDGDQTVGFGALAAGSAIIGGVNHNIPSDSLNSVILGGDTLIMPAATLNTVLVENLMVNGALTDISGNPIAWALEGTSTLTNTTEIDAEANDVNLAFKLRDTVSGSAFNIWQDIDGSSGQDTYFFRITSVGANPYGAGPVLEIGYSDNWDDWAMPLIKYTYNPPYEGGPNVDATTVMAKGYIDGLVLTPRYGLTNNLGNIDLGGTLANTTNDIDGDAGGNSTLRFGEGTNLLRLETYTTGHTIIQSTGTGGTAYAEISGSGGGVRTYADHVLGSIFLYEGNSRVGINSTLANIDNTIQFDFLAGSENIFLSVTDTLGTDVSTFTMTPAAATFVSEGAGIEYAADYSGAFTDRSLADWGNVLRANTTTTLTADTYITAGTNDFSITNDDGASKTAFITMNAFNIKLNYNDGPATEGAEIELRPNRIVIDAYDNVSDHNQITLEFAGIEIETETSTSGAYYADDYLTNGIGTHGDRWIPDWGNVIRSTADTVFSDGAFSNVTINPIPASGVFNIHTDDNASAGFGTTLNMGAGFMYYSANNNATGAALVTLQARGTAGTAGDATNLQVWDTRTAGNQVGLTYAGDYTADFVDRSLVDKGYVDANGGWAITGTTTLTGAVTIDSEANDENVIFEVRDSEESGQFGVWSIRSKVQGSSADYHRVEFQVDDGIGFGGVTKLVIGSTDDDEAMVAPMLISYGYESTGITGGGFGVDANTIMPKSYIDSVATVPLSGNGITVTGGDTINWDGALTSNVLVTNASTFGVSLGSVAAEIQFFRVELDGTASFINTNATDFSFNNDNGTLIDMDASGGGDTFGALYMQSSGVWLGDDTGDDWIKMLPQVNAIMKVSDGVSTSSNIQVYPDHIGASVESTGDSVTWKIAVSAGGSGTTHFYGSVTDAGWDSSGHVILASDSSIAFRSDSSGGGELELFSNVYISNPSPIYNRQQIDTATRLSIGRDSNEFFHVSTAPTGAADSAITWTKRIGTSEVGSYINTPQVSLFEVTTASSGQSFGGTVEGMNVLRLDDVATVPTGTLTSGGGLLFVEGESLFFKNDSFAAAVDFVPKPYSAIPVVVGNRTGQSSIWIVAGQANEDAIIGMQTPDSQTYILFDYDDTAGESDIDIYHYNGTNQVGLAFDLDNNLGYGATGGVIMHDDRAGAAVRGIEYAGDYSAGFSTRSLVDRAYVDANAGWAITGTTVLTGTTTIDTPNVVGNTLSININGNVSSDFSQSAIVLQNPPVTTADEPGAILIGWATGTTADAVYMCFDPQNDMGLSPTEGGLYIYDVRASGAAGMQYALASYGADFTDQTLIHRSYADARYAPISAAGWALTGTTTLTGAVIIDTAGNQPIVFQEEDATTNTILDVFKISRSSSGTPAAGIGVSQVFEVEDTGGLIEALRIDAAIDVVGGSHRSGIGFYGKYGGSAVQFLEFGSTGLNMTSATNQDMTITSGNQMLVVSTSKMTLRNNDLNIHDGTTDYVNFTPNTSNFFGAAGATGHKVNFTAGSTRAAINLNGGVVTADPSSLADGDVWYRSDTDVLRLRANGATVDIATGAGGGIGGSVTNDQIAVGATAANDIEGFSTFTYNGATDLMTISKADAGVVVLDINSTDTTAGSDPQIRLRNNAGNGDPFVRWEINGINEYSLGIDNSQSDAFRLTHGTGNPTPSSGTTFWEVSTTGDTIMNGALTLNENSDIITLTGGVGFFQNNGSATTTSAAMIALEHQSSGTPAAGFGVNQLFRIDSSAGVLRNAGRVGAKWVVATNGSEYSEMVISGFTNGAEGDYLTMHNDATNGIGLIIGTGTEQEVHHVRIALSAAQINTLNGTPVEAVAAAGAGKHIRVISASAKLTFGSVAYTNGDNLELEINGVTLFSTGNTFIPASADLVESLFQAHGSTASAGQVTAENTALDITCSTDADAQDSTIEVWIEYMIVG